MYKQTLATFVQCSCCGGIVAKFPRGYSWSTMASPSSSAGRQRTHLSLEKKVEVVRKSKSTPGNSVRVLVDIFGCPPPPPNFCYPEEKSVDTRFT